MVHRKKQLLGLGLFICLLLGLLCFLPSTHTALDALSLKASQIDAVYLVYRSEKRELPPAQRQLFLDILERAVLIEGSEPTDPFRPSEYSIEFECGGAITTYPFYWFTGYFPTTLANVMAAWAPPYACFGQLPDIQFYTFPDRRFDIEIEGCRYRFEQDDTYFWNEELSRQAFDDAPGSDRFAIDGFERDNTHALNALPLPGIEFSHSTAEEIMAGADHVVLAHCQTVTTEQGRHVAAFCVSKTLRGSLQPGNSFNLTEERYREHFGSVIYAPPCLPSYIPNETYLLCLEDSNDGYQVFGGMYGSAIAYQNLLYPRYNTEFHPFYQYPCP